MLLSDKKDDGSSSSSDDNKNDNNPNNPTIHSFNRNRSMSRNLIHVVQDGQLISQKDQTDLAQEMYSQMVTLKKDNERRGFHGYSGFLQRHNSDKNLIDNDDDNKIDDDDDILKHVSFKSINSITSTTSPSSNNNDNNNNNNNKITETYALRLKLENITSSINQLHLSLEENKKLNTKNNKSFELNRAIIKFQTQLTEIQDSIEDVENDIESNIDIKFIKFSEQLKLSKQKIKNLKKEKKNREKQILIDKQNEQKLLIEKQKNEIIKLQQLIDNKNNNNNVSSTDVSIASKSKYYSLDNSGSQQRQQQQSQLPLLPHQTVLYHTDDDDDDIDDDDDDDDDNEIGMQYLMNNNNNNNNYNYNPGYLISPSNPLSQPGISQISHTPPIPPIGYNTHYEGIGTPQIRQKKKQPLISDNAIKIIGGVVMVLAGIWIISKFIGNRSKRAPSTRDLMRRVPRVKY